MAASIPSIARSALSGKEWTWMSIAPFRNRYVGSSFALPTPAWRALRPTATVAMSRPRPRRTRECHGLMAIRDLQRGYSARPGAISTPHVLLGKNGRAGRREAERVPRRRADHRRSEINLSTEFQQPA